MLTPAYRSDAVRKAFRQGKLHRAPKSWIREAKRLSNDPDFRRACDLALDGWPNQPHGVVNEIMGLVGSVYYRRPTA